MKNDTVHEKLPGGIDLAVLPMPERPVVALEIRMLAGYAFEASAHLGVTSVLAEAITKGTAHHDGRGLNDAFDEIGAGHSVQAGRESVALTGLCLPEFAERMIELHAEIITTPTFPDDACEMAVELTRQSLAALDDDPQDLARKFIGAQSYGEPLVRHSLGEVDTLATCGRHTIVDHWKTYFAQNRMLIAIAGAIEPTKARELVLQYFAPLNQGNGEATAPFDLTFSAKRSHHQRTFEQEQVAICFPGAAITDDDFYAEQVTLGVLSGGMSGRLFTEVREKQGLVYWVGASSDHPRGAGIVHLGASTTPERVDKTYKTLLTEIERLNKDLEDHEVQRAIVGLVARTQTRGDVTRAKASELINELFYHGRPMPLEQKIEQVKAVTVADVQQYLERHPRNELSVVTVGPRELTGS